MSDQEPKCDATAAELSEEVRLVCDKDATLWDPVGGHCYCEDHATGVRRLKLVATMGGEGRAEVLERQSKERG